MCPWQSLQEYLGILKLVRFGWVQTLNPQTVFHMGSRDAAVCCDSRSDSICPSLIANLWLCNWQKSPPTHTHYNRASSMFNGWSDSGGLLFFHQSIIWPKYFEFWFISLLSRLCMPWPTGAFRHSFASSTVISWQ